MKMDISFFFGVALLLASFSRPARSQGDFQSFIDIMNGNFEKEPAVKNDNDPFSLFDLPYLPFEFGQPVKSLESPAKSVDVKSNDKAIRRSAATTVAPPRRQTAADALPERKLGGQPENLIVSFWNSLPLLGGGPLIDYDDDIVFKPSSSRVPWRPLDQKSSHSESPKSSVIFLQRVGFGDSKGDVCSGNACDGKCKNDKCSAKKMKIEQEIRNNLLEKFLFLLIPGLIGLGVICLGIEMLKKHRDNARKCLIVTDLQGHEQC